MDDLTQRVELLPAELQEMIWEYVHGDETTHRRYLAPSLNKIRAATQKLNPGVFGGMEYMGLNLLLKCTGAYRYAPRTDDLGWELSWGYSAVFRENTPGWLIRNRIES